MCPAESTRIIVNLSGLVLKSMHLWIQVSGHQHSIDSPPWSALILTRLSCSVWSVFFFLFFLCVCHCLADDESSGARTMSGSWEVCLYPGQHNLFLLKTEILREVPRVPSKFRIWREREEGGTRSRGNHIHSVAVPPQTALLPGNAL